MAYEMDRLLSNYSKIYDHTWTRENLRRWHLWKRLQKLSGHNVTVTCTGLTLIDNHQIKKGPDGRRLYAAPCGIRTK